MNDSYSKISINWQDHPLASLLPAIPEGLTLEYIGESSNEDNLVLSTYETGGCTEEQALEMIQELREMDYEELVCDFEDEESINVCVRLQDNYVVRIIFDKSSSETQHVRVFVERY